MSDTTIFYILGSALTALAVVISFIGIRSKEFPPAGGAVRALMALFALLVAITGVWAVLGAREEQAHRREHFAEFFEEAAHGESGEGTGSEDAAGGSGEGEEAPGEEGATDEGGDELVTQGSEVYASSGCGSCHVLGPAGSTGAVGPNLDETLVDKDTAYIEESIVDPDAVIADGYGAGIMPGNYGEQIPQEELDALVAYLAFAVASS